MVMKVEVKEREKEGEVELATRKEKLELNWNRIGDDLSAPLRAATASI